MGFECQRIYLLIICLALSEKTREFGENTSGRHGPFERGRGPSTRAFALAQDDKL